MLTHGEYSSGEYLTSSAKLPPSLLEICQRTSDSLMRYIEGPEFANYSRFDMMEFLNQLGTSLLLRGLSYAQDVRGEVEASKKITKELNVHQADIDQLEEFVQRKCTLRPDYRASERDLFRAWRRWGGIETSSPLNKITNFRRTLLKCFAGLHRARPSPQRLRRPFFISGLGLNEPWLIDNENDDEAIAHELATDQRLETEGW